MPLSEEYVRLVYDTVPIALVVSEYMEVRSFEELDGRIISRTVCSLERDGSRCGGKRFSCLCPFHYEKTPSFFVFEQRNTFKCLGCGMSGNVFDFVIEMESVSFPAAVQKVAKLGGVYPGRSRKRGRRNRRNKRASS